MPGCAGHMLPATLLCRDANTAVIRCTVEAAWVVLSARNAGEVGVTFRMLVVLADQVISSG
jgi:hypothetical protein